METTPESNSNSQEELDLLAEATFIREICEPLGPLNTAPSLPSRAEINTSNDKQTDID